MPDAGKRTSVSGADTGAFLAEMAGLVGIGRLGWWLGDSTAMRVVLAAALVVVAGALWGVFRTPGFVPSGGDPVVAVPGPGRLALELAFYVAGIIGFWLSGWTIAAIAFAIFVILVLVATRSRIAGLISGSPPHS